ncbi:MAG: hypothetical protein AB7G37_04670 [Solirubrobacteraceae bacterium]
MTTLSADDDLLVGDAPDEQADRFFDRFYFNLHGPEPLPLVMIGAGVYPGTGVVDGYVIRMAPGVQHNARFSTLADELPADAVGPLSWEVIEPLRTWRIVLGPNPTGTELDVVWRARTNPWETERVVIDDGRGGLSDFGHFFQSGSYEGELRIDGVRHDVTGWLGQRDRSRGVRLVSAGGGLHMWVQAQFEDAAVAVLWDEDRAGATTQIDGAVLGTDGTDDPIVAGRHDLEFDADLDFVRGTIELDTESGRTVRLDADGTTGGGFLSGGGYGGWHGKRHGVDVVEHEAWTLGSSVTPRTLDTPLTDRPASFVRDGAVQGAGIFEFAVTRSPSYTYRSTLIR